MHELAMRAWPLAAPARSGADTEGEAGDYAPEERSQDSSRWGQSVWWWWGWRVVWHVQLLWPCWRVRETPGLIDMYTKEYKYTLEYKSTVFQENRF